jgi:bifunctional DNA-binding transcriptional regulator/antitoxin component of YhaV-PrlF toxin-antitoxin module
METIELISMSDEGSVMIPKRLRRELSLTPGDRFVAFGSGDTVILKRVQNGKPDTIRELCRRARQRAREKGLTKKDLERAIRKVRGR